MKMAYMKWLGIVGLLLAATACGGGRSLTGSITLTDPDKSDTSGIAFLGQHQLDQPCEGSGGYDDMHEHATVVVKDGTGTIIGSTGLAEGRVQEGLDCEFTFSVHVGDSDTYVIEVAHRGELSYSQSELIDMGWKVDLTLGS